MNATLIDARVQWSVSTAPRSTSSLLPTYMYMHMFPSENGQRGDVHWLSVRSASGEGLHVSGSSTFGLSASRYSLEALERAKHPHELEADPCVHLSIGHKQMGVGGDTAWTRFVLPGAYFVQPGTYRWAVRLRPFGAKSSASPDGTSRNWLS